MGERVAPAKRIDWISVAIGTVLCVWLIGVPFLLVRAALLSFMTFWGPIPPERAATQHALLVWAAVAGPALPLAGAILAAWKRSRGFGWFFGIGFAISAVIVLYCWAQSQRGRVEHFPPPTPYCVERSGGGNECPGD
ncbi:hypothetical protein [Amycolatopsis samaneae]|uniref:Uncharacterized protein n=1 Tax=Amycolatopsis samaneae TaxID=664691 RepID=A0ABW5GVZ0_9PSEU